MFLLGHWKNYEELEETLTLAEVEVTLDAARKAEENKQRFAAALKGINLDDHKGESEQLSVQDIKDRVEQQMSGKSKETQEFEEIGIMVIEED